MASIVQRQRQWHKQALGTGDGFRVRSASFGLGIRWFRRWRRASVLFLSSSRRFKGALRRPECTPSCVTLPRASLRRGVLCQATWNGRCETAEGDARLIRGATRPQGTFERLPLPSPSSCYSYSWPFLP